MTDGTPKAGPGSPSNRPGPETRRLKYWEERAVKHECAGYGPDHSHYRLHALKRYDAIGRLEGYWPPFPVAKKEADREGYPYFTFDRDGGWAITSDEADCLERSWWGEYSDEPAMNEDEYGGDDDW